MKLDEVKCIAVIGSGIMGSGIAQIIAHAGYKTILYDVQREATLKGLDIIKKNLQSAVEKKKILKEEQDQLLSRITLSSNFSDLKCELVIEAIIERLETKSELFTKLEMLNDHNTIICTNTSSIPITLLAKELHHPERLVGMHFFNPAHIMTLVEVISGPATSNENATTVFLLAQKMGKSPVMVKDAPGFIVNRIGKLYHTESLKILEEQIAAMEAIDALLESSGFKMGPFKLIDLIGVDANLNVTKSLYDLFNQEPKFRPSRIQQQLVDAGSLGRKTGAGFYQY
ncbi:MAG: 3-hydroxybutyryl-CoA dehydrogenase [Chitinophagales bacterium]|nr:3-hydroxybutyryl-CoA dehydrogenase [Chitinophagales bacterium]